MPALLQYELFLLQMRQMLIFSIARVVIGIRKLLGILAYQGSVTALLDIMNCTKVYFSTRHRAVIFNGVYPLLAGTQTVCAVHFAIYYCHGRVDCLAQFLSKNVKSPFTFSVYTPAHPCQCNPKVILTGTPSFPTPAAMA